ncbi:MAG: hypothetical protein ACK5PP_10905 [Acidimicrobiales bacterium]
MRPSGEVAAPPGHNQSTDHRDDDRTGTGRGGPEAGSAEDDDPTGHGAGGGSSGWTLSRSVGHLLALVGFVIGARAIRDNSFLTHLATGRIIVETGRIPTADPYSYLAHGLPWTVQSWLVSLVYAAGETLAGPWTARLFHGLLTGYTTWAVWRLVAPARHLVVRLLLTAIPLAIGGYLWSPRPLLIGLAAFALLLEVIQGRRSKWWLLPLFWAWVNAHGSFILGGALLTFVALGALADRASGGGVKADRPSGGGVKAVDGTPGSAGPGRWTTIRSWPELELVALGALGCLLGLIPLGWRIVWFPFHMMTRSDALASVAEWQAPTYDQPAQWAFLALIPVAIIAARRGAVWRALLPSVTFLIAGLLAMRNIGLASLVVVVLLAPHLRLDPPRSPDRPHRLARPLSAAALAGLAVTVAMIVTRPALELDSYPEAEIAWLEERDLVAQPDVRLLERDYVGNYLTWRHGTSARVFMDDRFDFYPIEVIDDHATLLRGGAITPVMDRYDFDVLVWAVDTPVARWVEADDDWDVVVRSDEWMVACRVSSPVHDRCLRP